MTGFLELAVFLTLPFCFIGITYYLYCIYLGKQEIKRAEEHARRLKEVNLLILKWHRDQLANKPTSTPDPTSLDYKGAHNG